MQFLEKYPVFNFGCFYSRDGKLMARVSMDKRFIHDVNTGLIVGSIKDSKVYDEFGQYIGFFKNGNLYTFGGKIMGQTNFWNLKKSNTSEAFDSHILGIAILVAIGITALKIVTCLF